ncbi:MAG TPA: hypothetical protein VFQ19_11360 [Nocardioidaceae bacterium]|jgi:hypothetical protein|nr:hypothetical protein [Nocardioidaceae bacterium]
MQNEAKREAQEALFTAIKDQADSNMRTALRATEKAELLRDLAQAYRLTAGGTVPDGTASKAKPADGASRKAKPAKSADAKPRKAASTR